MPLLDRETIRILHIEDDDDFAELSLRRLRQGGFTQPVLRCKDGLRALDYFAGVEPQSAPHVVLLDLHLPGMNGLEILHWVRETYWDRDIAVYLLTSSDDPEHRRQAQENGVTDFLSKSLMAEELLGKLDNLIAASNERQQRD